MMAPVLLLGFCVVLTVAAIGVSLFAVWRTQILVAMADRRAQARTEEVRAAAGALQKTLDAQAEQLEDLQRQPLSAPAPFVPRAGLNLGKRTQVLRMYRNGDAPDRIAASLDVPRQEVDLLLKVHRIVIGSL
jgi:hypothetical protein